MDHSTRIPNTGYAISNTRYPTSSPHCLIPSPPDNCFSEKKHNPHPSQSTDPQPTNVPIPPDPDVEPQKNVPMHREFYDGPAPEFARRVGLWYSIAR